MAISQWPASEQPRERLLQLGVNKEDVMVPEREGADQDGLIP